MGRIRRALSALAGPALIVGAIVIVYRAVLGGATPVRELDTTSQFLPWFCHLGASLSAGHLPLWNPYTLGGAPFLSDPQSGWLYLPVMGLFSLLPCETALRAFFVLQPLLGGLGLYWFLRSEEVSRPAATVGGLVLAVGLGRSRYSVDVIYGGVIAWTTVVLAAASRYFRSRSWGGRTGWAVLVAIAWGQVAAAQFTDGAVIGTGALLTYIAVAVWRRRRDRAPLRGSAASVAILIVAIPLVDAALLAPRLAYLPRTSLGLGYQTLDLLARQLAGLPPIQELAAGSSLSRISALGFPEGLSFAIGAIGVLVAFAGLWSRRVRPLAVAFTAYGVVYLAAAWQDVASVLGPPLAHVPHGDFYLQAPARLFNALPIALGILVGLGVEAWTEISWRSRLLSVTLGIVAWLLIPVALGLKLAPLPLVVGTIIAGGAILLLPATKPSLVVVIPIGMALDLVIGAVIGTPALAPKTRPLDSFLDQVAGPMAVVKESPSAGRFLTMVGGAPNRRSPYGQPALFKSQPALAYQRDASNILGLTFRAEEGQGYNSLQLRRYWEFVRVMNPGVFLEHPNAVFLDPSDRVVNLMQVGWILAPHGYVARAGWELVESTRRWQLFRIEDAVPRASVITDWRVVSTPDTARRIVGSPVFDPNQQVILEGPPGIQPSVTNRQGEAQFEWQGTQAARVDVTTSSPALVLVRNVYDPNWKATVDGRPAPVLPADFLLQGVSVPAGHHIVRLSYTDPWVGRGIFISGLAIAVLLGLMVLLRRRPAASRRGAVLDLDRSARLEGLEPPTF